eukprot:55674-Eustigmatos_ZCMA.PRE.1
MTHRLQQQRLVWMWAHEVNIAVIYIIDRTLDPQLPLHDPSAYQLAALQHVLDCVEDVRAYGVHDQLVL